MPAAALPAGLGPLGAADLVDVKERVQAAVQRARKQLGMGRVNWGKVGHYPLPARLPGSPLAWTVQRRPAAEWEGRPLELRSAFAQISRT
jgi:hypothetical protein